jgi:uncharacterized protein (DUF1800 family)
MLMVDQPLLQGSVAKRGPTAGIPQTKGESRVEHALDRLTFGPRPGDVAAVEAMGLDTWFEMQLNPSKIDDSALNARLAQFPAMQLPQQELMARYPSQQVVRQMAQRQAFAPADAVEHAIYADQMEFYRLQQARQAAKTAAAGAAPDAMAGSAPGAMAGGATAGEKAAAPIERRGPQAAAGPANAGSGGGDMGVPDLEAMAPGAGSATGNSAPGSAPSAGAMLPKEDVSDAGEQPAAHVEKLFKDLEAVKIINLPPDERIRKVIGMEPADFVAFRQSLSAVEAAQFGQGLNPQQREIFAAMQNSTRMVAAEEMQIRLVRDIYSERQLEAVMTDFWLNHFNVYVRKNQNEPYLIPSYERDTIRPYALGKFEDLLVATAKSPAMLMYLDNWQSIGPDSQAAKQGPGYPRPFARTTRFGVQPVPSQNPQVQAALKDRGLNENYGRELMELHTLGVNGGYTQKDVTEVAKVFTGWTINQPARGGEFQFDERRHEPGPKTVLGTTIKENGMNEGLEVLHMLATSPATARFISTKLAVRFVSDDPPPALVDRMAQSFLSSDGDIKTVLRTMFESPEFWTPATERAKVKTPEEFVISAVRASGATVNNSLALVQALDKLGMPLYGMQTPNGYSWMSEAWVSTGQLVNRMNFALVLSADKLPGVRTDWSKMLGREGLNKPVATEATESQPAEVDPEAAAKERKLELALLGQPLSEKTRAAVLAHSTDSTVAFQAVRDFQGREAGAGGVLGAGPAANEQLAGPGAARANAAQDDREAAVMAGLLLGSPEFQRR